MSLKTIRRSAGLTQQQLADKSRVHRVTIARIENGTAKPGSDTLRALSTALGCTVDALMAESNTAADTVHNTSIA